MKHRISKLFDHLRFLTTLTFVGLINQPSMAQIVVPTEPVSPSVVIGPPTILGQPKETPYVVIIPTSDLKELERVQQYAPLAFMTSSRLGPYIQAGAFADRLPAESLSQSLREQGLDARVVYLRIKQQP